MDKKAYIKLGDLDIYKQSVELSSIVWNKYKQMDWQIKKIIGDQYIRATDSIGANIAEGYGRFHYKDRIRFYYNARGSLTETKHWTLLLYQRKMLNQTEYNSTLHKLDFIHKKLNTYISSCYKNI